MVALFNVSPPGPIHCSHNPAKAKSGCSRRLMYTGCLRAPVCSHSKKPLAGIRQRLRRKAERKDGFSAAVSERALIIRLPILASFAHPGISPHLCQASSRGRSLVTMAICCEGAMLKRCDNVSGVFRRSNTRLNTSACATSTKRPHMLHLSRLLHAFSCNKYSHKWLCNRMRDCAILPACRPIQRCNACASPSASSPR